MTRSKYDMMFKQAKNFISASFRIYIKKYIIIIIKCFKGGQTFTYYLRFIADSFNCYFCTKTGCHNSSDVFQIYCFFYLINQFLFVIIYFKCNTN